LGSTRLAAFLALLAFFGVFIVLAIAIILSTLSISVLLATDLLQQHVLLLLGCLLRDAEGLAEFLGVDLFQ
jgi:hypothetical protein